MPHFRFLSPVLLCAALASARGATPAASASQPATAPSQIRYLQLINTNAADAARLLNAMYATMPASAPAATTRVSPLYASSDARTNTVVLTGPPDRVAQAWDLLQKMDQVDNDMQPTSVFFIYHLKLAHAAELAPLLNQLFHQTAALATQPAHPATAPASPPNPPSPAAALAGAAYFVPNPDTNSLLVTTDATLEETLRTLLSLLDRSAHASPPATQPTSDLP